MTPGRPPRPPRRLRKALAAGPARPARIDSLAGLAALKRAIALAAEQAAEQAALQAQARAAAERQQRLFADSVGPFTPLPAHGLHLPDLPRPLPLPLQRERDERAALQESMSDEVDIETLLLTDDGLSFQRPGLAPDVLQRLRRGHWTIQGELDLHGLRSDAARTGLAAFLREAGRRGWRCLRVVHGKGHGSPGRVPVLKAKVQRWLGQSNSVLAFTQASAPQGGAGALIVLLRG